MSCKNRGSIDTMRLSEDDRNAGGVMAKIGLHSFKVYFSGFIGYSPIWLVVSRKPFTKASIDEAIDKLTDESFPEINRYYDVPKAEMRSRIKSIVKQAYKDSLRP